MLAPAPASGCATEDRIPTIDSSNGPSSFKACQLRSLATPSGTSASGHTTESSSSVRVTEKKDALVAHAGMSIRASNRQTARRSPSTVRVSSGAPAAAFVPSEGLAFNYSTLPAGRVFALQTSAMRFATSPAAAASGATASTVSWPAIVPTIFSPLTLSRTLETAPAVPSRVCMTTWFCVGTMPSTKLGRTSIPAEPGSCGRARSRLPTLRSPSSARSRLTVACATSTPSSASAETTSCCVPRSCSEMRHRIRSCLVVLSICDMVAPKTVLLLEMLEPEVLLVAECQVHVLYRRPGGALEQVVYRREEQHFPCPAVYRRRKPAPVGVGHVGDLRILLPGLHKSPALVVLCVPAENLLCIGHLLRVDHDRLELTTRNGDQVRYERHRGHLPYTPQKGFDLGRVPMPRRPVGAGTLVHADEVRLYAGSGASPTHPREGVYGHGAYPFHPPHDRCQRQNGRGRIAPGVGDKPPRRSPEDFGQPVVRLRKELRRRMLTVPLAIQLLAGQPEVGREVDHQARLRPQQFPDCPGTLAVPVGHESHIEVFDLLGRLIRSIDGELRIDLPDPKPHIPARRHTQRPHFGMPGEQPYQLHPGIPTPTVDAYSESHAAHCRTSGYLFKFLHKLVDALLHGCDNSLP